MMDKTLKQLKAELVKNGMPESDAELMQTKAQAVAVLNTLKASEVVKKVDTLEEKETPVEKKLFETQWVNKRERMKRLLLSQPKVMFMIPLEKGEKPGKVEWDKDKYGNEYQIHRSGAIETVQLNGFKWMIPKGVMTEIPQQIAEELSKSMNLTMEAGKRFLYDRVDEKTGKPLNEII